MKDSQEQRKSSSSPRGKTKGSFFAPPFIQSKLTVNKPGDKYELEADAVADRVVSNLSSQSSVFTQNRLSNENPAIGASKSSYQTNISHIQTKCAECEAEENNELEEKIQKKPSAEFTLQAKEGPSSQPEVSNTISNELRNSSNQGNPIPKKVKTEMEDGFGKDFSQVRIHTDHSAQSMSKNLGAQAFTYGSNIYFNTGKFETQSQNGKKLLAHELTHVVQQREISNLNIQRAIGDGHDLSSPRFARDTELEEVFDGNKVLDRGERGGHVNKIQHAIQDKGHFLLHFGIDGEYEGETERGVTAYQLDKSITTDPRGKVGTDTMAALDSDFPAVADNSSTLTQNPADIACIQEILCPWNEAIINDLRTGSRVVIFVDNLFWADEIFQGGSWQPHPMPGAGETSGNTIRLNISDDCEAVAQTLYHEYQHARSPRRLRSQTWADEENYAYSLETNWSISRGLSPDPSLVTTDPVSGDTVLDQTGVDAQVATYPGMATNEEVIEKVGSTRVRVRRDNGTVYVRNAANGDTVPGPRQIVNPRTIRPADWPTCP
ncbi:DUF4157 domain-containing protein [Algoriphagus sp. D3-2-R+10]|uniref:eCIS core domain-containing protein n=1 Tax=Algoriphagus aurantiacus TaxID=3103948 RepID=UPI002B3B1406|nr:DUF4157 domain-containing protein [Algoriphagus sp. D3-2-R+10]MEB2773762.1 DUF4157 domain-containing protein [Algoriphagus sp. D3-2-R+10]